MILAADTIALERGSRCVLDEVSAQFAPGEIAAIVGPNGAGKSSLLLALAGLLEPVSGSITLGDQPLAALTPRERAQLVGYLPQDSDIAWDVAVEALVALGRLPHGDRGREAVEAAMSALNLDALRHRPVSRLSGGEKARVLLARVLATQPRWILADEPLAALDLAHQQAMMRHLRSAAGTGTGIIIVLHDLAMAMNHADRVVVLDNGALAAIGEPAHALSPGLIETVWGVEAQWLGKPGQHALITRGQ